MARKYDFSDVYAKPTPYRLLMAFALDEKSPRACQIAAATGAGKLEPGHMDTPIELPTFTSIEEAEAFKLELSQKELRDEYVKEDIDRAISRTNEWINGQYKKTAETRADAELELKRLAADVSDRDTVIRIEGGLPALPGTNVTMPDQNQLNGHQSAELTISRAIDDATKAPVLPGERTTHYPPGFHKLR